MTKRRTTPPKLASQKTLALSAEEWTAAGSPHVWIPRIRQTVNNHCICVDIDTGYGDIRLYALKDNKLASAINDQHSDMVIMNEWFGHFIYLGSSYGNDEGLYSKCTQC